MSSATVPTRLVGLSQQEASARLAREGANEIPRKKTKHPLELFWGIFKQPMFLLLFAAGAIYMLLGEPGEAIPLAFAVLIIILIEFFQERRTERALEALREIGSPTAHVMRDGELLQIRASSIVTGDLIVVSEGERVPADASILSTSGLNADESLLTGESVPVTKRNADDASGEAGKIYSGTLVTSGTAIAEVQATGVRTRIGQIGTSLQQIVEEQPLLKMEINRLVRIFGVLGIATCILIAALYRVMRGDWLQGILAAVTAAISLIPEEFPVVLTIFLALGAWRIAKHSVLARNSQVIETLGAANVLCVDKTGTITLNQMAIRHLLAAGEPDGIISSAALTSSQKLLLVTGVLASKEHSADPMEAAFHRLAIEQAAFDEISGGMRLVREYPLTPSLLAVVHVWEHADTPGAYRVTAKGAPEAIALLSHMDAAAADANRRQLETLAAEGMRVLGVAQADFTGTLPGSQLEFPFRFLGLVGFEDPVRPGVREAMQECHTAGVRVVMITGDHPATAVKVAKEVGLPRPEHVVTGKDLDAMSSEAVHAAVRETNVFARVAPHHKLVIVETLKEQGQVVAMTGDGVNDAPALKAAHIGIAMGKRGTDVAREAAGLVLLHDDFTSIVAAIRAGRRVYDNLRRAVAYIIALHIPLAGLATLPLIFGWPLLVFPLHILFFEFVTDPACAVVFEAEPETADIMDRKPRNRADSLISLRVFLLAVLQGSAILGGVLWIVYRSLAQGHGEDTVRALAITALILANLGLILVNRSWTQPLWHTILQRNASFWIMSGAVVLCLLAIFLIDPLRQAFKFSALTAEQTVWCAAIAFVTFIWFEVVKLVRPRWAPGTATP